MTRDLIDSFLAGCVRACLEGTAIPPWPTDLAEDHGASVCARIKFHGIALLLAQHDPLLAGWPTAVIATVRDEARMQALWEASHRRAIAKLLEAFNGAAITAVAMKGTALAYGHYADPAIRRRGDTDLYLPGASRAHVRQVLAQCGYSPAGERRPTQEPWSITAADVFVHEVDIHWRINDSLAVSRALDNLQCEARFTELSRLAPDAIALSGIDNVILTSVNRALHGTFGYHVEEDRLADGDRLIWAVDIKLVTDGFTDADWTMMARLAAASGTSSLVQSALAFADRTLGLGMPCGFVDLLPRQEGADSVAAYVAEPSGTGRFRRDLLAVQTPGELFDLAMLQLLPGKRVMAQWYPDAEGQPLWALRMRRLAELGLRRLGLRW